MADKISEIYAKARKKGVLTNGLTEDMFREQTKTDEGLRSFYDIATANGMRFHPFEEFKGRFYGTSMPNDAKEQDNTQSAATSLADNAITAAKEPVAKPVDIPTEVNNPDLLTPIEAKRAGQDNLHNKINKSWGTQIFEKPTTDMEAAMTMAGEQKMPEDLLKTFAQAWSEHSDEGKAMLKNMEDVYNDTQNAYLQQFQQTQEYANLVSKLQKEVNAKKLTPEQAGEELSKLFVAQYGNKLEKDKQNLYSDYLKEAQAALEQSPYQKDWNAVNAHIATDQNKDLNSRIDSELEKRTNEIKQQKQPAPQSPLKLARDIMADRKGDVEVAKATKDLQAAKAFATQAEDMITSVRESKNFFADFGKSFGKTITSNDTWDFGVGQLMNSIALKNAADKADKGEPLTHDEELLLEAAANYMAVSMYYSDKVGRGTKAGQTTAASIPFMLEFMLTSGVGAAMTNATTRGITRFAIRMLGNGARKKGVRIGAEVAGKTLSDIGYAELLTNTLSAPRIAEGTISRMNGSVKPQLNDSKDGFRYDGRTGQQELGEALWNAHSDQFIENYSEVVFGALGPLKDPAKAAIKSSKLLGKMAAGVESNAVTGTLIRAWNNPTAVALRKETRFGGLFEETMEEEIGGLFRLVANTDVNNAKDAGLDIDSQIDIVLGLAPSVLLMNGAGATFHYSKQARDVRKMREYLKTDEERQMFDRVMSESRSGEFGREAHDFIREIIMNNDIPNEAKRQIILQTVDKYKDVLSSDLIKQTQQIERQDRAARRETAIRERLGRQTNESDGKVYRVSIADNNTEDNFIKKGNVVLNEDGTIDKSLSDKYFVVTVTDSNGNTQIKQVPVSAITNIEGGEAAEDMAQAEIEYYNTLDQAHEMFPEGSIVTIPNSNGAVSEVHYDEQGNILVDVEGGQQVKFTPQEAIDKLVPVHEETPQQPEVDRTPTPQPVPVPQEENPEPTQGEIVTFNIAGTNVPFEKVGDQYYMLNADNKRTGRPFSLQDLQEKGAQPIVAETPQQDEQVDITNPKPIGTNKFGTIYQWVTGKAKEAAQFLRQHKNSYLKGVFHRDDIGDIDLVWGNDKAGLQHIIKRHILEQTDFDSISEAIEAISNTIQNGDVRKEDNSYVVEYGNMRVIVSSDGNGNWIVTAYDYVVSQKDKKRKDAAALGTPSQPNDGAGAVAPNLSNGKGTENNSTSQENSEEKVPDVAEDNAQAARKRGFRMENGHRIDRQQPIENKADGRETNIAFGSETKDQVPARYTLIDASELQPSHKNGVRNRAFFIDEAQPKERTDQVSVVKAQQMAQQIRPGEITRGESAYTGAPIVNSRGEVVQGNNRSAALREMYDGFPDSVEAYKQFLRESASEFGLTAEGIDKIQNPVLVRMTDIADEEAIRLGNMTAADTESGGSPQRGRERNGKPQSGQQDKGGEQRAYDTPSGTPIQGEPENSAGGNRAAGDPVEPQQQNKIFTEDAYEAARRRMHERLNRLNAGLDPEMLSDGLIMAGYHVEKGARKFAEFAREMIREFGDKIRPYLKSFYNGLRDLPEAVELSKEMDDYGTVAQFDVNNISIERAKETKKTSDILPSAGESVTLQPKKVDVEGLFGALNTKGEAKLSDHIEQESLSSANAEDTQPIGNVTQSKHTKTGEDIWIVKPSERVSDDEFKLLKARAKANNGYYSSFAKNRGFIFKSKEDANNFNNISDEEITTDQTSADTETAVRTAETVVGETATITRDRRDSNRAEGEPGTESIEGGIREPRNVELTPEQANKQVTTRQQAIAKIDNANDKITDQFAVLGFYEADTSDPTKLHESYGYIKTAEAKAVKDIDRLAKQLADDLGIKVSNRKTIAKANIAPAGGDISFRLPLENGKELYLSVDLEPNFNNYYRADGDANSLVADHMFWRIEDPQANGTSRYLTPNQNYGLFERGQVTTTYADLLRDIHRMGRDYLSTIPTGTTKQEIAKQVAEKTTRKKKDTTRIADTQPMLDLFGDVAETMNEGVQQEQNEPERKFVNAVSRHLLGALVSEDMQTPFRSILDLRKLAKESGIEVDDNGKTDILLQELVEDGLVRAARQLVASGKYGDAKSKATYDAIVHLYEIQPTIAQRSSNRIAMQQYSTPLPMAFVADMFAYEPSMRSILEPTAGNGMLVFAVPAEKVHANELDETRLANLHLQEFQEVTSQDATEPFDGGKRYDAIIANPPFGSSEEREYDGKMIAGLDPQITLNALASMKDSGKAAIIIGGNMEYADNGSVKDKKAFWSYLYDHYNVKGVVDMDGQLYRKQGTTYPTRMILIDGRRSEAEREQTTIYPPIQQKAIAKVNTFDDLYNTIAEITNSNKKTNGTEILRTAGGSSSVSDSNNTSGNTGVLGHSGKHSADDGNGRDRGQRPTDSTGSAGGNRPNDEGGVSPTSGASGRKVSGHSMGGVLRPQEPVHGLNTTSNDGSFARPERTTTDGERSGKNNVGRSGRVPVDGIRELGTPGDRVGLKPQQKRNLTEEKLPYRPHNTAFSLQSVAPAAMVEAMDNTLSQIEQSVGKSIDQFVTDELGYDTIQDAHNALAAEQMDSVAMAIYQMQKGQALIIGDQTGVGKGRQMAALIRWAVRQGKKPIFITQKADLFSDIYRDLVDIGSGDLRPFIFNSATAKDGKGIVVDANGNEIYKALSDEKTKLICLQSNELPDGFDYVLATYSQFNSGDNVSRKAGVKKKKELDEDKVAKATFLRKLSRDNYLFLDESHTAAGESNTGTFFQSIIGAKGEDGVRAVTFASATFAKRPDTMPMYALRTAMAEANVEREKLIGIIEKGGVTLQEIMSRALTESGQMVRRERDMTDVKTDWKTIDDPATTKRAREQYDRTIVAFNAIIDFQDKFITPLVKEKDRELAEVMSTANLKKGTKKFGVDNTPFASKTFNYTKQLMLALKVDAIVDEVEREIKAGRHPVIALESTMESTIKDYAPGEIIAEPSFSASLLKGLDTCMQYTVKDDRSKETHMTYAPNELGAEGEAAYYKLQDFIRKSTEDIFISPLDAIIERLREKGYRVGELTGRNTYVERTDDGKVIVRRRTDKDKKRMQREFNSGALDVLILNKSASTGISLHASEKFSDQRQRSMIIAQPLSDINDYMQMIGRIDRTGQVHRGYYINLGLPVPAESRFLMMLSTKLKSLNANTTTSQDSESNEVDAPDLLNKYGSQVVIEYLRDNPTIYEKIGEPLKKNSKKGDDKTIHANELDEYTPSEDDALKITGRVALLNTKEQEEFYNDVVRRYNDLIRYLNDTGTNDLKITTLPLRAKTISRKVSSVGREPNGDNPFAGNAYVEQVEMDVLRKPMKANEVQKLIVQLNGASDRATGRKHVKDVMSIVERETEDKMTLENERYENAKQKAALTIEEYARKINANEKMSGEQKVTTIEQKQQETEQKLADKHSDNILSIQHKAAYLNRMLDMFTVGETYLVPDDLGSAMFSSSTHSIFCGYKVKDSKISASTSFAVFATLDGRRKVEIKLSDIATLNRINDHTNQNWDAAQQTTLDNWDKQIPTQTRKEGYIMTGNILQAVADTQDEYGNYTGQLISYTDIDGNIHDGILMPDKWETSQLRGGVPISARLEQMKQGFVVSTDGKVTIRRGWCAPDVYFLIVPKSKSEGGKYFLNPDILHLVDKNNFYTVRGQMQAEVPAQNIVAVLDILSDMGVKAQDSTPEAQYDELDYDTDNLTDAQQLATDAVLGALDDAGISVERVSEEEAEREIEKEKSESSVRLIRQMAEGTKGQSNNPITAAKVQKNLETAKRKLETATWREDNLHTKNAADVSSLDDAKVRQKIDISKQKLENQSTKSIKNPVSFISDILELRQTGSSYYGTFKLQDGSFITLRLSNHNATVSNFDNEEEAEGVSIVISAHPSEGIRNDGTAHIVEYFYRKKDLWNAYGTPLADILGDISELLRTGEYKDTTGLAQRQEVNIPAELQSAEFSIRQTPAPKNTGIGYKVFYRGKDGKLYPPMVANPNGADTPIGVWLNADAAPISGESKTGRPQVKAGGKGTQGGSGQLAYRPGWHLGEIPYALQFNRKDENGDRTLFPKDFVWAEVEYAADVNYQQEAEKEGVTENGKYRHSYAGLKHLPTDGYYRYRTNPNPETDPWIITGAMKVNRVLTNEEVDALVLQAGREPQQREFFRTSNGTIYGYAKDGKIYLTDKGFNPNTPIHEYTHLWAKAMQAKNPQGWQSVVDLLKGTPMWDEVVNDPHYSHLTDDNAVASEVLSRYSGSRGAQLFEQKSKSVLEQNPSISAFARVRVLLNNVREALNKFWNWVGKDLFHIDHFDSIEEVADRILYDLTNGTDLGTDIKNGVAEMQIAPLPKKEGESIADYAKRMVDYQNSFSIDQSAQKAQFEYEKHINEQHSALRKLEKGVTDFAKPIMSFQEYMVKQGAVMDIDSDTYQDIWRAGSRTQTAINKYHRECEEPLANTVKSIVNSQKLNNLGFVWQNLPYDSLKKDKEQMNGTAITPRRIVGLYLQAKDCEEALQLGLVDRGAAGFEQNVCLPNVEGYEHGVPYTKIIEMVEDALGKDMVDILWKRVRAAVDYGLDYQVKRGMISEETRNKYKREFYVPQRGWEERDMSGLATDYQRAGGALYGSPYNLALKQAKGRTSLAADPFAYITSIAYSSITSADDNVTRQHLLKFCLDNEELGLQSGAFRIKKFWVVREIDADGNIIGEPTISYAQPTERMYEHDKEINAKLGTIRKQLGELNRLESQWQSVVEIENINDVVREAVNKKLLGIREEKANLEKEAEALSSQLCVLNSRSTDGFNLQLSEDEIGDLTKLDQDTHRTKAELNQHVIYVEHNGQKYALLFKNEQIPNALNKTYKSSLMEIPLISEAARKATRLISATLTQYNPEFAARNYIKDRQTAITTLSVEQGAKFTAKFEANLNSPLLNAAVMQYAFNDNVRDRGKVSGKYKDLLNEYFEHGAQTGYSFLPDLQRVRKDFDKLLKNNNAKEFGKATINMLSVLTEASETSIRFAAYVTARESGMSADAAASLSKELTTNFNRHGEWSNSALMSLYSFMRATINGNLKYLRGFKKFPIGFSIAAAAYYAAGVLCSLLNPNDPDNDIWFTDYVRETNITLGKFLGITAKIPLGHFMVMFYAAGVNTVAGVRGNKSAGEAVFDTMQMASNELLPSWMNFMAGATYDTNTGMGFDATQFAQSAAPSVVSPFVDVWLNRNFMGGRISNEYDWNKDEKDILKYKSGTSQFYIDIANGLYEAVGGDLKVKNKLDDNTIQKLVDVSPSATEHIVEGYSPAIAETILQTAAVIQSAAKGADIAADELPFVRKFYSSYHPERAAAQQYYMLKSRSKDYSDLLKEYQKKDRNKYNSEKAKGKVDLNERTQRALKRIKLDSPSNADIKTLMELNREWNKID